MRFPTKDGGIDEEQGFKLLKAGVDGGINYFDTAYPYHDGKSEEFLGRFLKEHSGLKREEFYVSTKLPTWEVSTLDDAKRIFSQQLKRLQLDYVDFYMLHDLKLDRYEKMEGLGVYDYCRQLQAEGKIKYFGHSSHENAENFNKIISAKTWDFVMLHLNYMDLDNMKLYEIAKEKDIPVIAMETVKGGSLSNLPDDIRKHFSEVNPNATVASWGIRWAGSLPNVKMILSGMSDIAQVSDNISVCSSFTDLSEKEHTAIKRVEAELRKRVKNNCTGCNYCMPCPMGVNIPWVLSIWNEYGIYENKGHTGWMWSMVGEDSRPHNCNECGKCNEICPQNIDVISDLKKVASCMEKM
jgi:hypothetical protein